MDFSKQEQFDLLEKLNVYELQQKFGWEELYDVFTISREEYINWEVQQPLSSCVRRKKETFDGLYFIEANGQYEVYWQERGIINGLEAFSEYSSARRCLAEGTVPYFLYKEHRIHKEFKGTPNKQMQRGTFRSWLAHCVRYFSQLFKNP